MSTVTDKGQVTIPKAVRDHLGIGPGTEIRFRRASDGSVVIEPIGVPGPRTRFSEFLGHAGPGPSTDEIMAMTRGDR